MKQPASTCITPSLVERRLKSSVNPIGQTRRTFFRRSTATGLAVAAATLPAELDAKPASNPTGSRYPMSLSVSQNVDLESGLRLGEPDVTPAEVYAVSQFPPGGRRVVAPDYVVCSATWPIAEPEGVSGNTPREEADLHVHHRSVVSAVYTMVMPKGTAPPLPPAIVMDDYLPLVPAEWTIDVERPRYNE